MTLTHKDINNLNTELLGHFRFRKMPHGSYLITNDAGKYHFFSENSFRKFLRGDISQQDMITLTGKGFIKDELYESRMVEYYRSRTWFVGKGPTLHMMVITLRCNHHCRYCHAAVAPVTATQYDMTQETAKKCVDTILHTNAESLTIEFQWWEALLNWEVLQFIVEYATTMAKHLSKSVHFALVTNLTLMTEEKLKWLMDRHISISTSLDGDKVNHNHNRTGYEGDSYDRVSYWIQRIHEVRAEKNMWPLGALLTVTRRNMPDYKNIIEGYRKLGLNSIFLRWLNPYGFAASDLESLAYSMDEWLEFYIQSMEYILDLNKQWVFFTEQITTVYLMKILFDRDPWYMDIRNPSGIAIWGVAYNYDGKIYASDESRMLGRMGMEDFLMTPMQETGAETYSAMIESDITKIAVQSSCLDGLPGYDTHAYKPYFGVDIIHNFKMYNSLFCALAEDEKMQLQIGVLDYIFDKLERDPEARKIFHSWVWIQV